MPATFTRDDGIGVTAFSQHDGRWSLRLVGSSDKTLGEVGCLVTCLASALCDLGYRTDPGTLNIYLAGHCGFIEHNLMVFDSVCALGVSCAKMIVCRTDPAPMELIADWLSRGGVALVEVDAVPGGQADRHWVRVVKVKLDDCLIMDPWQLPGFESVPMSDFYFADGWNAARAIFRVALYERVTAKSSSRKA